MRIRLAGLQELLNAWGCSIVAFRTGKAVLEYCSKNKSPPDAILADYNLEDENGLDVIQSARDYYGSDIDAALITADRSEEVQRRTAALGVSLINKPVRPAILRALLSHFRQSIAAE